MWPIPLRDLLHPRPLLSLSLSLSLSHYLSLYPPPLPLSFGLSLYLSLITFSSSSAVIDGIRPRALWRPVPVFVDLARFTHSSDYDDVDIDAGDIDIIVDANVDFDVNILMHIYKATNLSKVPRVTKMHVFL